jgi:transposase-like protein
MKKCGKCSQVLKNQWDFCPNCGEKVPLLKKSGNQDGRHSQFRCPKCNKGRNILLIDARNGPNPLIPKYCHECGTPLRVN